MRNTVHRGVRRRVAYAGVIAALVCPGRPLIAQEHVAAKTSGDMSDADAREVLGRPVTLHANQMPLRDALSLVAAQAKVFIAYQHVAIEPPRRLVTVNASQQPFGKVLEQLLVGTNLQVFVVASDAIALKPSGAESAAQAAGVIKGVVRGVGTQRPIPGVTINVEGTKYSTRSGSDGTFQIASVAAGAYRVVFRSLGYQVHSEAVTVKDDDAAMLTVLLAPVVNVLNEVVTTATGDRKRLEVGNAVGTIKADSIVPTTLIRNMSDLLQARVPGVVVSNTDGAVGAPSKIRLRGVNSIALNNDPIIIVDGVRINAQTTKASLQPNVGATRMLGQIANNSDVLVPLAPSRLDDIDPNTIESIDVLRGPSASSLYGTDAANGVIVIKTKRGQAGSWRLSLLSDYGQSAIIGGFPEQWIGWGEQAGSIAPCYLAANPSSSTRTVASGGCTQDSVTHFNPQNYGPMRTLGTGTSKSLSANLSGGTQSLQQFFSAQAKSQIGMAKMSDVEQRIIARYWSVAPPDWMVHPNTEQDYDGSSRTTVTISPTTDVSVSATGISRAVLNSGSGLQTVDIGTGLSPQDTLGYLPSENQRTQVMSSENRGTLALTANARPWSWMSLTGTTGGDYGLRTDEANLQAQYCTLVLLAVNNQSGCASGRNVTRGQTFVTTANWGANLSFTPFSWLTLHTALGEQYAHTQYYSLQAQNPNSKYCPLAFGSTLLTSDLTCVSSSMQKYDVNENRDEAATAGVYLEESVTAFGLFYTFGVRRDLASAFGSQVTKSPPKFPKLNVSYPLSDQAYFPKQPYVTSLRLRLAYGQSGSQASRSAVLNNYNANAVSYAGSTTTFPVISVTQLGNADLQPEKSTEWEGGFDASFLPNERLRLETTLYRKFTRNMITSIPLAPSLGLYSLFYNLGNVDNRGLEVSLNAKVIDTRLLGWDLAINGAKNTNKLVHKAPSLPPNGANGTQFVEGFPLYSYFGLPVASYADLNGDRILAPNELTFGQRRYMGAPFPNGELTYHSTASFWNGAFQVAATLDHIIGQTTLLQTAFGRFVPRAAVDRSTPLAAQAAYLEAFANNGYIGTSSTLRLNELSATYVVPTRLIRGLRVQSLLVTLAGRNLTYWSSYAGKDPNIDTSGFLGETSSDNGLGTPQPRTWALRFNLGL